ncbi:MULTISPECIES: AbiV family abortive infection protein [Priestia]|uniref:AbiV family abortive infection protein n=1 Tax=Priestia TaxID=2800373 RepID=UPI001596AA80|nr:AbiV family abortive infection protein [Priestia aryabhattai]
MNINQLKVDDLEKLFLTIYENACELLEEAELLYNHERYARAYLCSHIAFEEFGKLPMLYSAALNVYNEIKVDWKFLNKRIRNHKRKISMSYSTAMQIRKAMDILNANQKGSHLSEEESVDEQDFNLLKVFKEYIDNGFKIDPFNFTNVPKDVETNLKGFKTRQSMVLLLNEYKNGSLYADYDNGVFKKPSEKIDKDTSVYGFMLAYMQKKFIEIPSHHLTGFYLYKFPEGYLSDLADMGEDYKEQAEKNFFKKE